MSVSSFVCLCGVVGFIWLADLQASAASHIPQFEDFPARGRSATRPAPPLLRTKDQIRFRTQLRSAAADGPNFAGHFTIADWGCGTNCSTIALIDSVTGVVYKAPFNFLYYGPNYTYEGGSDHVEYYVSSNLLICRGCPDDKECGTFYYVLDNNSLRLIREINHGPLSK